MSRHHRVRPEVGEDWGAASRRAAGRAEPPKNRQKRSGKNRRRTVRRHKERAGPPKQPGREGWVGKKREVEEKTTKDTKNRGAKRRPWGTKKGDLGVKIAGQKSRGGVGEGHRKNRRPGRSKSRSEEDVAEREKGTEKRIPGRQNSRSEKDVAERERGTGNRIPGRQNSRSERDVAERERGTGNRISGRQNSRSEKDVAERERGTGNRIPGRQNSRPEKDLAEREMGSQESKLVEKRVAGPVGQDGAEEEGTRNDKEPPTEEATKQLSVLGEHIPKEAKPKKTASKKSLEGKYCKIPSGIRTRPSKRRTYIYNKVRIQ